MSAGPARLRERRKIMQTLKRTVVSLDAGDILEVRCGDVTARCELFKNSGRANVYVTRPISDGRALRASMKPRRGIKGTPTLDEENAGDMEVVGLETVVVSSHEVS